VWACIIFYVIIDQKEWTAPLDFSFPERPKLWDSSLTQQYWSSMYHSVMTFGLNEVAPRTVFEVRELLNFKLGFFSFVMLLCALVNATVFGNMAVLAQELNKKT
jgi:hypothetical protein